MDGNQENQNGGARGVATAESLRDQQPINSISVGIEPQRSNIDPSVTDAHNQIGGTITETGQVVPAQVQPKTELPTTGGSWLGGFFKKLNPIK